MKLNLGCGGDIRDGWVNIDLYSNDPRVTKYDITALPYERGSVDQILAQDVLEHISHRRVEEVLAGWVELLKPAGTIEIRTPDIWRQAQALLNGTWDFRLFRYMMFGGQDHPGNFHYSGVTVGGLMQILRSLGLTILVSESVGTVRSDFSSDNPNILIIARK